MRDHNSKSTQRRRASLVAAVPSVSFLLLLFSLCLESALAIEILSKSKIERCERGSDSGDLNCTRKIVLNMAVPSGSSGGEASIVAEIAEVEENSTSSQMETLRVPPVITINKSAAYALYELSYIRDVAYKPQEFFVKTRKCARDAGAHIVKICERLRDEHGHIMENTQPICCPCGNQRRMPSSCGNFFDKMVKGKANTAHCLRFLGDWFHVLGIGQRSLGFSVRIEVKTSSKVSEVVVDPHNRTVVSSDNFLRVNLIGDFGGYTNLPSFEDFYLVIPRQGSLGQPQDLGRNFSMWMLLERVRFTLDGLECNKIGVSYEAFNGQPNFCSTPFWSCLHNQLWNFWDADQNRKSRNQLPLYTAEGRFERINQHPNAGSHSFSIGVTEVLTSNLLIEVSADDIEYVYQRSPGKILSITIPTFEALTQFGSATITSQNIGDVEASYSITFDCVSGVTLTEEQFFIMKPKETTTRSFKLQPTNDQAAEYKCSAILKDSDFKEVDRAECQFTTTATILDNGTQIAPFQPPPSGVDGFFGSLGRMWKKIWTALIDFISGKTCRSKCSRFFDFSCHLQYLCMSWVVMFGLFLAIFPTVMVLLWLLHQKGLFDPFYDWWEDRVWNDSERIEGIQKHGLHNDNPHYTKKHRRQEARPNYKHDSRNKQRRARAHQKHRHSHSEGETDYYYNPPQVHKHRHKHKRRNKRRNNMQQAYLDGEEVDNIGHYKHKKQREIEISKPSISKEGRQLGYTKHKHEVQNKQFKSHEKQK